MSVLLTILKIILYTAGIVVLLAILLSFVRIKVTLVYVEYFSAEVRALGLRLFYFELKEKDEEAPEHIAKKKKKEKKQKKEKKKKEADKEQAKEKKNVKEVILQFKDMAFELLGKFKKHLRLEQLDVKALISTEDAAKTALVYTEVCAAGACIAEYAENIGNKKKDCVHVRITPDFIAEKCDLDLRLGFSLRIWHILSIMLTLNKIMKKVKEIK